MKLLFKLPTTIKTVLILSFFSQAALAQTTDKLSLSYQQFGESNDVTQSTTDGRIAHRMFLDEDGANLLTFGVNFSRTDLTDDTLTGDDKRRELRTFVPDFNLMRILDEEYSLVISLRPGFYGDLEGNMGEDFRLEGGVVVTKFMSDSFTLGFGLGRGTNFGRDLVVPLVQFLYFANDKVVVRGLLPVRASVWYIPDQKWEYGLIYRLSGSLYNIDDSDINGAQEIGFASAQLGGAARYKVYGNSFLVAEAGVTALRRYEWTDRKEMSFDIGKEPFLDRDLDRVPYLRFGWLEKF